LFEALTLIQTKKIKNFPIVIFDTQFHKDLIEYIDSMKKAGTISPEDLDLMLVTDSVDETVKHIEGSISRFGLKYERKFKPVKWLFEKNGTRS
ncbi:MAG TPA: LOG family protein, partial [Chitinophagaceae bacterium]|nr:LOG family protein [Chitinophagaceae bacterium]